MNTPDTCQHACGTACLVPCLGAPRATHASCTPAAFPAWPPPHECGTHSAADTARARAGATRAVHARDPCRTGGMPCPPRAARAAHEECREHRQPTRLGMAYGRRGDWVPALSEP